MEECSADAGKRLTKRKPNDLAFPEYVYPSRCGKFVFDALVVKDLMSKEKRNKGSK